MQAKPTKQQVDALVELAHRVEMLWQIAYRRLQIADAGDPPRDPGLGRRASCPPAAARAARARSRQSLADPDGAYQRLRRVMDAWTRAVVLAAH